jgi:hypothetical protein
VLADCFGSVPVLAWNIALQGWLSIFTEGVRCSISLRHHSATQDLDPPYAVGRYRLRLCETQHFSSHHGYIDYGVGCQFVDVHPG